ncbi:MAG: hypothetical protein IJR54_00830 [Oscillibacter sp.]|nr:hypothetical protein [Oscillibacter sp.]
MARKMNPEKPGVMIYFNQIRGLTKRMDDRQKVRLLDAIVNYAELGIEPDFSDDPLLDTAFYGAFALSVDRDDERFTEKSINRKYSNYARWSEKDHAYVVSREEWRAAGCPPFSEIKKRLIQMDTSGIKWNQMDFFYSVWNTLTATTPSSILNSLPLSSPTSESAPTEPPDGGSDAADQCGECDSDKAPPYEIPTLEQVERYCQRKNLTYTNSAEYCDYYAANGWMVGVNSGNPRRMVDWKAHIRRWDAGNRKRAESGAAKGRNAAAETLRALREKYQKEDEE